MTLVGQLRWLHGRVQVAVLEEWPDGMCVVQGGTPAPFRGWAHKRELAAVPAKTSGFLAIDDRR